MTSQHIRQSFLDFFKSATTIVPSSASCRTNLLSPTPAESVRPIFLGKTQSLHARSRRGHAEVHPRRRQTQRPRRRRTRHVSPHVFRDAGQLELWRLLQAGSHRVGVGTGGRQMEISAGTALRDGVLSVSRRTGVGEKMGHRTGTGARADIDLAHVHCARSECVAVRGVRSGSGLVLGAPVHCGAIGPEGAHHSGQQKRQLLDDGRDRSVRSVFGIASGPHARRRHEGRARQ